MGIKDKAVSTIKRPVYRLFRWLVKIGLLVAILVGIAYGMSYGFDRLLEWMLGLVSTD